MVDMFVRDIVHGIGDTGIKAGVIKCATDVPGVTKDVERVLRACAQAHRQTGVPLTTLTNAAMKRGLDQQRIFKEEGVDLGRVVIGHCGDTDELDYLLEVISNGSILGRDRFGLDGILSTEKRVATVAELCTRGYADQIVLSHDCGCFFDWIPGELPLTHAPNWSYVHISNDVLPMLRKAGVNEMQIDEMLIQTPSASLPTPVPTDGLQSRFREPPEALSNGSGTPGFGLCPAEASHRTSAPDVHEQTPPRPPSPAPNPFLDRDV